jgi:7-keto-8-aminopelargonate synthetase-like enzyme
MLPYLISNVGQTIAVKNNAERFLLFTCLQIAHPVFGDNLVTAASHHPTARRSVTLRVFGIRMVQRCQPRARTHLSENHQRYDEVSQVSTRLFLVLQGFGVRTVQLPSRKICPAVLKTRV